jgi:hypothetical protein
MKKEDLLKMIGEDELGLLEVKPQNSNAITADERLISSFEEINKFFDENDHEPKIGAGVGEHLLATRLKSIREDSKKSEVLKDYDRHRLLNFIEKQEVKSVKDIISNDDLGILDNDQDDLFDLKNIPELKKRESADFVARRKACRYFEKYEQLFIDCQNDLASGKRKLLKFTSDKQLRENGFFVINGVLLFIEKIGETYTDKYGKIDGRQRCIFENGTESEMLFRSLTKRLYENGKAVSENIDTDEKVFLENFNVISKEDKKTGFIYVLKSLSNDPKIQSIENLYKIGFSTTPVEERIKNAADDPTYLMAAVKIVTTFECYNLNPQKMEQLLHNFFGSACLNFDIFDKNGKRYTPREWFIAPLRIIEKAISLIINGGIVNYQYDSENEEIVLR